MTEFVDRKIKVLSFPTAGKKATKPLSVWQTLSQSTTESCGQRVSDDCTGDYEVYGAGYRSCSLEDKLSGISRSQVPSIGYE